MLHASDELPKPTTQSDHQPPSVTKLDTPQKSETRQRQIYIYSPPPSLGTPPVPSSAWPFPEPGTGPEHYITNVMGKPSGPLPPPGAADSRQTFDPVLTIASTLLTFASGPG